MKIHNPLLVVTPNMQVFLREVTSETKEEDLAYRKGIMIYHPATGSYYATWSKNPLEYRKILNTRVGPKWEAVALVLRKMLSVDPHFQFFVLPISARATVERWMADQGKLRVVTKRGEAADQEHILFQVYSYQNKFTRFVCAPADTTSEEVIAIANESMTRWLTSRAHKNKHERETMQVALRARFGVKIDTIERTARVSRTDLFRNVKHNEFSSRVTAMNLQAIRDFILATTKNERNEQRQLVFNTDC